MRPRFALLLGAATAPFALTPPAVGAPKFPTYDSRSFCVGRVASSGVADCVSLQDQAAVNARVLWLQASDPEKIKCIDYVENDDVPPSYMRLRDCLEFERKGR